VNAVTPFERAWHYRELIRAILSRELAARFRGSVLGWVWALAAPLIMMGAYTVVFSGVVAVSGSTAHRSLGSRSLVIFSGITLFNFFAELLYRAPGLLHEHAGFIRKSIFPSETLAWIAVLRSAVYAGVSFVILLAFQLFLTRQIPWTIVLVPAVVAPFFLFLLGTVWFLMALGAFTRDVTYLMASIAPVLMLTTPVFFSVSDIPVPIRHWVRLNIVADYIEMFRSVVLYGELPNWELLAVTTVASYGVFLIGYAFFVRYKAVFVDVL
jgi:lipopolysaccharide transport system permease protein